MESLRGIETSSSNDQTTRGVADGLSQLTNEINARIADDAQLLTLNPSLQMLQRLKVTWQNFGDNISEWNSDLTRSGTSLDEELARLDELNKIWESTLHPAIQTETPPEVLQHVLRIIDSILATRKKVASRRAQVLSLQNRLFEQAARIQTALASVERSEGRALKGLLLRDSRPIWNAKVSLHEEWSKNGRQLFSSELRELTAYAKRLPSTFLAHLLITLVLVIAVHWLRRGVQEWSKREPSLQRVAPLFDLPVSTALVFSCVISRQLLYAQAPRLLLAIIGASALIPTVLILRRLLDRNLFPILNTMVIMYFVDQLREITAPLPLLSRILFLGQMLSTVLFLAWLTQGRHLPTVDAKTSERLSRAIGAAARLGLVVLPAAFLASIFGYLNLANLLGSTFLWSAYLAAILYVAIRIAEGVITIILQVGPLSALRVVQHYRPMLFRRMCGAIEVLAFIVWLNLMLGSFELRAPLIDNTAAALGAHLIIGSLNISLGQVMVFTVTVLASFLASRFLRFLLEEDVYYTFHLERGIPQAISTIVHYAVLLLGFFLALAVLGVDLTKVTILAGAFTVGVGFGLQNVINNFVSGLILLFERPIKVGDVVQVDADIGEVQRIGIRACVIRTADGSEVIVPNGAIISNKVKNWTFSDRYRAVEVSVSVARGADPRRIVELLKCVAANHPSVAKEPAPHAYIVNFAPGAVSFQLRAWTDRYDDWVQMRSDLSLAVDEALARENITIA